jgi:hypothetical protein
MTYGGRLDTCFCLREPEFVGSLPFKAHMPEHEARNATDLQRGQQNS